jgi:hypothetical protein
MHPWTITQIETIPWVLSSSQHILINTDSSSFDTTFQSF